MAILLDSCSVMRGCKTGVETRLRESAPHLLDVDGDTLHHVHNAVKKFTLPFEKFLEKLPTDVHTDLKWSPDIRTGMEFTMPTRYVPTRWLTIFDAVNDLSYKLDAYTLLYYSFLKKNEKLQFLSTVIEIYRRRNVSEEAKNEIKNIRGKLAAKKLTDDGAKRKTRIICRLFVERTRMLLYKHFYASALPLLKEYVLLFQKNEPQIHKLHDEFIRTLKEFLAGFCKPEVLSKLVNLSLDDQVMLPQQDIFVGTKCRKLLSTAPRDIREDFMRRVTESYQATGKYLLSRISESSICSRPCRPWTLKNLTLYAEITAFHAYGSKHRRGCG